MIFDHTEIVVCRIPFKHLFLVTFKPIHQIFFNQHTIALNLSDVIFQHFINQILRALKADPTFPFIDPDFLPSVHFLAFPVKAFYFYVFSFQRTIKLVYTLFILFDKPHSYVSLLATIPSKFHAFIAFTA